MIAAGSAARDRRIAGRGRAVSACQIVATIGPRPGDAPITLRASARPCDVGTGRHRHQARARSGDRSTVLLKPARARDEAQRDFEIEVFPGKVCMRRLLLALGLIAMADIAQAEIFKIPEEKAAISIDAPDGWSPNLSDDTIDMTSPDRAVFFWLTVEREADAAAVKAEALKAITRNGMKIDQATVKEAFA